MLWWDDDTKNNAIKLPDVDVETCFRHTGTMAIRKVSKTYAPPPRRKMSMPAPPPMVPRPRLDRKLSCPAPNPRLSQAVEETLLEQDFLSAPPELSASNTTVQPRTLLHPKEEPRNRACIVKVKIQEDKVKTVTREPDVRKELKRGSMRDKWGISLVYRSGEGGRLEVAVSKVGMFSPAAKAGLAAGNTLVQINDWKIEAMDHCQTALSVLLAAGFSVHLAWLSSTEALEDWGKLDAL